MSLHPLDVFPETIWTRIFENVKRPWPSIWRGGHNCCFQPVLARLMAVHPALHELVGPMLYRECVVVDLEMFFVGLDGQTQRPEDSERFWTEACQQLMICERVATVPPALFPVPTVVLGGNDEDSPSKNKRSSKRDLLCLVQVLHLATAFPRLATASLMEPFTRYSHFHSLEKAHVSNYLATRRGLEMFHRASSGASPSTNNPLGRLNKITLDLYHEPKHGYEALGSRDTQFTRVERHARDDLFLAFDRFLTVVRPKWVCQHRAWNHLCRWISGGPPFPSRQVMGDHAPAIFVSHDCGTRFRLPSVYACRRYAPRGGDVRLGVLHWFQGIDVGCSYRPRMWLASGTSAKDWPTLEFVLEEQHPSCVSGRLALDSDKAYRLIKHEVAPELHDKIRVIVGGNEAQSPWGSCGCPAAVETYVVRPGM